jgi:selenide,water dikinase
VRAAPVLAHNLAADLAGRQRRAFRPQKDFLKLISMGGKMAVAEKRGLSLSGPALWRWKDRIDARFMARLRDLPKMPVPRAPADAATGVAREMAGPTPCGGCGAKLGAAALPAVIAGFAGAARADTERLPGDDAAVIRFGAARQVISTDHLRAFALDPALVARVAAVHALGDVWAMGAEPQSAVATVILPRLEARLQGAWLGEVMGAAHDVFAGAGAACWAGIPRWGTELTVGFTVTGLAGRRAGDTWRAGRPGDALILTKPVGSGVILAAEMQGKALGEDVLACWEAMARRRAGRRRCWRLGQGDDGCDRVRPRRASVEHLRGFGHGRGDRSRSGPASFEGALALSEKGVRSTLFDRTGRRWSRSSGRGRTMRARTLLFDPQTAGGLLAAVDRGGMRGAPVATCGRRSARREDRNG